MVRRSRRADPREWRSATNRAVRQSPPAFGPPGGWRAVSWPPDRSPSMPRWRWAPGPGSGGSLLRPLEAANAEGFRPVRTRRLVRPRCGAHDLGLDLGDRLRGEQEGAQVPIEDSIVPAQPLEDHRGMFLLLVSVVGEDRGEACVRGRLPPLVVPVDRLQLLTQGSLGPVLVDDRFVEKLQRLPVGFACQPLLVLSAFSLR